MSGVVTTLRSWSFSSVNKARSDSVLCESLTVHRLCHIRVSIKLRYQTTRRAYLVTLSHRRMGRVCSWYGFCDQLGNTDCSPGSTRDFRSWPCVPSAPFRESLLMLHLVFPGAVYIIGSWYRQYETGKRIAVFYMAGLLASGFGPIVCFPHVMGHKPLTGHRLHTDCPL